ncbi:MAG: hypothetical protein ACMXYG_04890 [Candidatus Woesearchaeota archaeon]
MNEDSIDVRLDVCKENNLDPNDKSRDICPFAFDHHYDFVGCIMVDEVRYHCSFDGGNADGGIKSLSIPSGSLTPCDLDYAINCPKYILMKSLNKKIETHQEELHQEKIHQEKIHLGGVYNE